MANDKHVLAKGKRVECGLCLGDGREKEEVMVGGEWLWILTGRACERCHGGYVLATQPDVYSLLHEQPHILGWDHSA